MDWIFLYRYLVQWTFEAAAVLDLLSNVDSLKESWLCAIVHKSLHCTDRVYTSVLQCELDFSELHPIAEIDMSAMMFNGIICMVQNQ